MNPESNKFSTVSTYALFDHYSIGHSFAHISSIETFRSSVIDPLLKNLDEEISKYQNDDEPGAAVYGDHLAEIFQRAVESFLLSIQAMWERGIRGMLIRREKKLNNGKYVLEIQKAKWSSRPELYRLGKSRKKMDIQEHFEYLMGISLLDFHMYQDIDLLQNFGNAIRHGDGTAAEKIHQQCPSLWVFWMPPGTTFNAGPFQYTTAVDGPKFPSFDSITLAEDVLTQMVESVLWFWRDIEGIRLTSLRTSSDNINASAIEEWHKERSCRQRIWTPA